MSLSLRQFKQIWLITFLLFGKVSGWAQTQPAKESRQYKNFAKIAARAGINFTMPDEFKEIPVSTDNSGYDYAMALTGQNLEIWLKITPAAENTPDSLYLETGRNQAKQLAGDDNLLVRNIPGQVLTYYNADAGKTYFINLPYATGPKRYKYALLITLQKSHRGSIMAVCLANDKGPDFFKNINKAGNCIKFKAGS